MKVRIGNQRVDNPTSDYVSNWLTRRLLRESSLVLSDFRLNQIANKIRLAGMAEMASLYSLVYRVIQSHGTSLQGSQLVTGLRGYDAAAAQGTVPWQKLDDYYVLKKQRLWDRWPIGKGVSKAMELSGAHFVYTAQVRDYFKRGSPQALTQRFGGVRVTVDRMEQNSTAARRVTAFQRISARPGEQSTKEVLARLHVDIFPNIDQTLLPMLSSHRWTATDSTGKFEQKYLPTNQPAIEGTGRRSRSIGLKLSGGDGHRAYRPLFLPIVQFMIKVRIPAAVRAATDSFVGRRLAGEA